MPLSPRLYSLIVRPHFAVEKYINRPISKIIPLDFRDKKVLDFGCGTGSNVQLFRTAQQYVGVDVDADRIAHARTQYPQLSFFVADKTLPFPSEHFDYIFIIAVLHHIDDVALVSIMRELFRVLRVGGEIVVLEPVFCSNTPFRNRIMNLLDAGAYIRYKVGYLRFFRDFDITIRERFVKFGVYNELLFTARRRA